MAKCAYSLAKLIDNAVLLNLTSPAAHAAVTYGMVRKPWSEVLELASRYIVLLDLMSTWRVRGGIEVVRVFRR